MSKLVDQFNSDSKHYVSSHTLIRAMLIAEPAEFEMPRGVLSGEVGDFLVKLPCGEYTVLSEKSFNLIFAELEIGDLLIMEPNNEKK